MNAQDAVLVIGGVILLIIVVLLIRRVATDIRRPKS